MRACPKPEICLAGCRSVRQNVAMKDADSAVSSTPTSTTHPWLTPIELLLLGAIWGASFLFMRVAARDFGPIPLVEVRLALGALILLPFLWPARAGLTPRHWWKIVGIGAINSAIPFSLFAWAAQRAPAGIGAISNATAVMFTALVAYALYKESIGARRVIGLIAGFVGVAVLASGKTEGESVLLPALAGTLGGMMYGFGANFVRHHLADVPSGAVAASTVLCATVLLAPFAMAMWPDQPIPATSWTSAALLGVLCTGAAYWIYYRLIYRIGPAGASTVTYLIPLFGVIWAWLVLDEPLTATMAVAGVLILGGVALSQQRRPAR
jgi:drug/metabolite transporter (DMT)-like permease